MANKNTTLSISLATDAVCPAKEDLSSHVPTKIIPCLSKEEGEVEVEPIMTATTEGDMTIAEILTVASSATENSSITIVSRVDSPVDIRARRRVRPGEALTRIEPITTQKKSFNELSESSSLFDSPLAETGGMDSIDSFASRDDLDLSSTAAQAPRGSPRDPDTVGGSAMDSLRRSPLCEPTLSDEDDLIFNPPRAEQTRRNPTPTHWDRQENIADESERLIFQSPRLRMSDEDLFPSHRGKFVEEWRKNDSRWKIVSEQAGQHKQDGRTLRMCAKRFEGKNGPKVLKMGIPQLAAERVQVVYIPLSLVQPKGDACLIDDTHLLATETSQSCEAAERCDGNGLLPEWLDIFADKFTNLQHLHLEDDFASSKHESALNSQEVEALFVSQSDRDGNEEQEDNILVKTETTTSQKKMFRTTQSKRLRRLYILYRLPKLLSIDGLEVTERERMLANPDPKGYRFRKDDWVAYPSSPSVVNILSAAATAVASSKTFFRPNSRSKHQRRVDASPRENENTGVEIVPWDRAGEAKEGVDSPERLVVTQENEVKVELDISGVLQIDGKPRQRNTLETRERTRKESQKNGSKSLHTPDSIDSSERSRRTAALLDSIDSADNLEYVAVESNATGACEWGVACGLTLPAYFRGAGRSKKQGRLAPFPRNGYGSIEISGVPDHVRVLRTLTTKSDRGAAKSLKTTQSQRTPSLPRNLEDQAKLDVPNERGDFVARRDAGVDMIKFGDRPKAQPASGDDIGVPNLSMQPVISSFSDNTPKYQARKELVNKLEEAGSANAIALRNKSLTCPFPMQFRDRHSSISKDSSGKPLVAITRETRDLTISTTFNTDCEPEQFSAKSPGPQDWSVPDCDVTSNRCVESSDSPSSAGKLGASSSMETIDEPVPLLRVHSSPSKLVTTMPLKVSSSPNNRRSIAAAKGGLPPTCPTSLNRRVLISVATSSPVGARKGKVRRSRRREFSRLSARSTSIIDSDEEDEDEVSIETELSSDEENLAIDDCNHSF